MNNKTAAAFVQNDLTLKFDNIVHLKQMLLEFKGKWIRVQFSNLRKTRSNDQNRYYWGVVVRMIADHCGYYGSEELDALHEELKKIILPCHGKFNLPASTAKMNTEEFSDYVEKVRIYAAENLGLYIPDPHEAAEQQ